MTNYYTSDLHLCCKAALRGNEGDFDNRPFETLEEMQGKILTNWNKKVTNADHVYILGDLDKRGYNSDVVKLLAQLKGNKHLIVGNHDTVDDLRLRQLFTEIADYKEMTDHIKGIQYKLVLSHYPIFSWNAMNKGAVHLYGHVHDSWEYFAYQAHLQVLNEHYAERDGDRFKPIRAYNVGTMLWDYTPVSLKEILERSDYASN